MHILIKFNRKGTKSKKFTSYMSAADFMDGRDFKNFKITKVDDNGKRINIPFKTSNLENFIKQLKNS
jgi:hypothetical protein